ncbi:hypothetical protein NS355_09505 [Sphingomonas yabuuchiae]|uniref:Uncharacterized protein n=1 Tax=Sphingomonas yabuuchiae TaxID=172044 RepID=A0A147ISK5_9SPHN|nr:hypothetical protein [Sphingomonas yabuuchiae]KTT98261.1 hypothetical protein NS355_09505 [Sphingomonas yabuuchiae]
MIGIFLAAMILPVSMGSGAAQSQAKAAASEQLSEDLPSDAEALRQSKPLAARRDNQMISKNEAYNRERRSKGRVGIRLGNDVGIRVSNSE